MPPPWQEVTAIVICLHRAVLAQRGLCLGEYPPALFRLVGTLIADGYSLHSLNSGTLLSTPAPFLYDDDVRIKFPLYEYAGLLCTHPDE